MTITDNDNTSALFFERKNNNKIKNSPLTPYGHHTSKLPHTGKQKGFHLTENKNKTPSFYNTQ